MNQRADPTYNGLRDQISLTCRQFVNPMESKWDKDYPLLGALSEAELDDNSSLKKMLQLVGNDKKVIDFGCATGYLARLLRAGGCEVTGIEISPKAAEVAERYCDRPIMPKSMRREVWGEVYLRSRNEGIDVSG